MTTPSREPEALTDVLDEMEWHIAKAGSLRAFARKVGVSAVYISDVRHGKRNPGARVLRKIGFHVDVVRTVTYTYTRVAK